MPWLLRDVLHVIETFHKYARKDGDKVTLTCRELKRLIQGEFGDNLQPRIIHAVERNLNLLTIDSDGTISFDEFVLTIFNLLNLHYLDIQSLLNSEPREGSKPEEKPDDMNLRATSRTGQPTEGTPPTQDKLVLPLGTVSSAQLSPEESRCNREEPQGDTKTHKLPGEASGHSDPKNQHLEGDGQREEVTQDIASTGDQGAENETNKPTARSEQKDNPTKGEEGQEKEIPKEEDQPAREQSDTNTGDQTGEQEGNLGTQSSPPEETTQRPPDDQRLAAEKVAKEHSNAQEQPLQGKDKLDSEGTDLPEQTGHNDPKNQHLEGNGQHEEVTQDVASTGDKGAENETNKPTARSEQKDNPTKGEEGEDKEIPKEEDQPAREQSDTNTGDQIGEQEGNLGTQSSPPEETTQRPPDDQRVAAEKVAKEHSNAQEQPLQGEDKLGSEGTEQTGHSDPKNQHLEGDGQREEVTQDIASTGDQGAENETNKPTARLEQKDNPTKGEEGQEKEIPKEEDQPAREQSDTNTGDQTGEQEGNLGTQSSPPEETTQRPPDDQRVAAEKVAKEHSNAQEQPLQGEDKLGSEGTEQTGHSDPKNQHLEGDGQREEVTQDIASTGDKGAENETNKPTARSEQKANPTKGEEGQEKEIPKEEDQPAREPSDTNTGDQIGEQEGNLGTQSSPPEETTQRPPDDQRVAAEKVAKEHSNAQEQPLQGKDKLGSEGTDLPEQTDPKDESRTAETQEPGNSDDRTPPETENAAEPEGDGRTPETQELPAQEKEHETNNLSVPDNSRHVSGTPDVRTERKEGRGPEAHEIVREEERESKSQPPALEEEAQDGKYPGWELQESAEERDAGEDSKTQELSSEGEGQKNHPEIEEAVTPGEEARHAEEGTAEACVSDKNAPAAEGIPGAGERIWELSPLENKSGAENERLTKTQDKLVKEEAGSQGEDQEPTVTQKDQGSSETPNSLAPEDDDSSSETSDPPMQGNSQSQTDSLKVSVQGSHNNNPDTQKQVALGEKNRIQAAVGGEDERLTKQQEPPEGKEHKIQSSETEGPGPALKPSEPPEAQTHLETEKLLTSEEEDKSPQGLAGEQNPAKKGYNSSVPEAGLEERTRRNEESYSAESSAVYSSPLYKYLQEILQQTDLTKESHQNQA